MTYELSDGTALDGEAARVCRWLDANDPLSDRYRKDTDAGTAELFAATHPEARWCEEARRLVLPTGLDNYYEAPPERLDAMIAETCSARLLWAVDQAERAAEEGDRQRARAAQAYAKFARRACASSPIAGAARMFRVTRTIRASELNEEGSVIGTPDGVVDLDDGELLSDRGEDGAKVWHVTKRTRARVSSNMFPEAEYDERWDEFVLEIMCGDEERAAYLKRALGYSVFGGNPEECMFVAYGATTRNGKGTLMESVAWALGDYAATVDHDYLMERRGDRSGSADEETASLDGVRLVTISEPTKGKRLDEARVKMLTGGDTISCRHLYGPKFEYRPQFTMWMSCNRLPVISDSTVLSSGRLRIVPFERHFGPGEQDPGLKARFRSEAGMTTVLTWLLEGYLDYRERGLDEPASVRLATESYAGVGGSTLSRFVDECCSIRGSERMSVPDFNAAYRAFCDEVGEPPLTAQRVRREFEEMGVIKRKLHGTYCYMGIGLNEAGFAYALEDYDPFSEELPPGGGNMPPEREGSARRTGSSGRIRLS